MSDIHVLYLILGFGCGCFLAEICPPDWHQYGKSCYYIITDTMDWYKANRTCAESRANLAIPNSHSKQDYIWELAMKELTQTSFKGLWIGCNDIEEEGKWQHCPLKAETNAYENWNINEPNGLNDADCGMMRYDADGKWDDQVCIRGRNAVCELSVCSRRLTPQCLLHHAMEELLGKSAMQNGKACQSYHQCHSFSIDNCSHQ